MFTTVDHVVTARIFVIAVLLPFWFSVAPGAWANDLTSTANAAITLDNRVEMLLISGKIPFVGKHPFKILISPGTGNILSSYAGVGTSGSKRAEIPRTSGKLAIAGGLGKRILTISAEMYDSETHTWLSKGNLAIGHGNSVIPFNGRVLVWMGIIMPF